MLPQVVNILRRFLHKPGRQDVGGHRLNIAPQFNYFDYQQGHRLAVKRWPQGGAVQVKENDTIEMAEKSATDLFQITAVFIV